ncbi:hypothetical protein ACFVGN_18295 [Streptomyces sp. NPDC057757]|uniref:hypothetical protein n=1 Tax=Streptomyces sp. NPDC057757 TaxID=3346241 RepID=UPI0036CB3219
MRPDRPATALTPFARLPRAYRQSHIAHSTVDAHGRAHWLLTDMPPASHLDEPHDARVVTVENGRPYETHLSGVRLRHPSLGALPDGGFVLADARSRPGEEQVQVFDALGRPSWAFRVGDAIEDLLVDETGDLWVSHFDEGIYGDDELSWPGLRRWSGTGDPLWEYRPGPGHGPISDCYALNVGTRAVCACPSQDFPLLEIREDRVVRVRENPVKGARGFAVHADRVVFFAPYGHHDRIVDCRMTREAVRPLGYGRLVRADGGELGRRRSVCRGPRIYVQEKPFLEWGVLDISVT